MKRILITGASGFIGRHTINLLINEGFEVSVISRKKIEIEGVICFQCNLHNHEDVASLIKQIRPTHLLHLSWDVNPETYINSLSNYDWVFSSFNLLKCFHEFGGKRAVFAGSCFEYSLSQENYSEYDSKLSYETPYSASKNTLQSIISSYSKTVGISVAWARIFFLYGIGEKQNRLVSNIVTQLLQNKEAVCRSGSLIRDYLYVKDVANAFVSILKSQVEGIINIGSGSGYSLRDIANMIATKLEKPHLLKIYDIEPANNDSKIIVANTSRLKNEVKWKPFYNLEMGLEETIRWWRIDWEG